MKTFRVTLTKDGAQAACTLQYKLAHEADAYWSGNVAAFKLTDGQLPDFDFPIDSLPRVVAHQASQSGATFTIEDLGGEAVEWRDNIIFESDPSDSSTDN